MSKERARRREVRVADSESRRRSRERRQRWTRQVRRLDPRRLAPRRRRVGRLFPRRTRAQRSAIASGMLIALVLVWLYVDALPARIALTALIAVTTPAVVVLALDRRM
ncbi:MAG TPA: hypothetical protein VK453_09520 [Micromonosporaceae bacterium]|nr:hypothetical protein [Micromonosporaceae bacterium]